MSGVVKHDWPPNKEIAALVESVGMTAAAKALGLPRGTVQAHCRKHDLPTRKKSSKVAPVEIPEEVSDLEIAEQRVKELEKLVKRDRKEHVYDERIASAVESAVADREPKYNPKVIAKRKPSAKHEFALLWSDLHAGEVVSREETNGINSYDWQTMLNRHDKLRDSLFSYQDNRPYAVEKLNIWAIGDMLSGNIHDELVATNEIPLAEASVQLAADGAEWIRSLLDRFAEIKVTGVVGNHPRAHKKPWAKQGYDNADWTSYFVMQKILADESRVSFTIPKANQCLTTVATNHTVLLWHGDSVRSSMPGVPWGGVMRRVQSLRNQYVASGQPFEYAACGHFHSANAVEGGHVLMNGSIKGVDEYSIKAFGGGQPAQQVLTTFHSDHGLTDFSPIDLQ